MPGYAVHLAIAQEYLRKHNKEKSQDFILGSIEPDFTNDKSKTHYGESPAYTNLKKYLKNNKIDTDFKQGYFLHLVTDYLFYNYYLEEIKKPQIYYDYDMTNKTIIEKYKVILPEKVKSKVFFKDGTPQILTLQLAYRVIDEISELTLEEIETIEQETIVEETNELLSGETKVIQGVQGNKLLNKEITYYGLNKDNENIVSENIITPVVNTIVKTGIKSPYEAGVAFLSNPTKGGYVSSTFGEVRSNSVHKGIDIAKDLGEDVSAALEGEVIYAGYNNGGYGNLIILQHNNNMKTYYAHLSNIYVSVGEIVKKNDLIGAIGSTGNSTGPHLHFELRVDNNPVNPIKYIQQ